MVRWIGRRGSKHFEAATVVLSLDQSVHPSQRPALWLLFHLPPDGLANPGDSSVSAALPTDNLTVFRFCELPASRFRL